MRKKIGKTFRDAELRLKQTEAAYRRAQKSYAHWVSKLISESPVPVPLKKYKGKKKK